MTKEEKLRQQGLSLAYHLVKEGGIEELKKRLTRTEQTKCPVLVRDKALRDFEYSVKHNTLLTTLALSLLALSEEFDLSTERLADYCKRYIELIDTCYGGWLGSWEELAEAIKEEKGIDIYEWLGLAEGLLGKAEDVTDKREIFVAGHKRLEAKED